MKDLLDLLDRLGLLVREASLGRLDLWDHQGDQDLRDLLGMLGRRAFLGRKDRLAQLEGTEFRAQWVCLVQPDLLAFPERTETKVKWESLVRKAPKEQKESMVLLVHPVQWVLLVSLVLLELMERLVPEGNRDILELKVMKEPEVSQELQDLSGCRGCLVHQVRRVRLETSDLWAPLAHQDLVAQLDPTALTVPKDLLVVWGIQDLLVRRESLERPDHLALGENQERRGPEVSVGRRERPVSPGQLGLLEEEADQETMAPKETLVLLVSLVILVPRVRSDPEVKTVQRAREERTENKENLVLLDPPERMGLPDHQERGGLLGQEDQRDVRERRGQRETQVLLDLQERLAQLDLRDPQESQALKASEDYQDQWVSKGLQEQLGRKDHQDLLGLQVWPDCVEIPELKERRVTLV